MNVRKETGTSVPQGDYVPAKRHGKMIFTSGMTPRKDGVLLFTGPVTANAPVESYRDAAVSATSNALQSARALLVDGEVIGAVLSMTVYIAAESGFVAHSKLADYASQFLKAELGERGIGSRAAVGVATPPGNAALEVQIIFIV